MERYLIAIDGGGTKTEGVLCLPDGTVKARVLRGASNPNDVGTQASVRILCDTVRELRTLYPDGEYAIFAGVAGALNHKAELLCGLLDAFPDATVAVGSDVENLLSSEIPIGNGACIVSGTGSACFVREGDVLHRIGGWGYLLDDAGSGYDIGRDAILRVLMAHDGRRPETTLAPILEKRLGKPVEEAISEIYAGGKPFIASLAPDILAAAEQGDADAYEIAERSIAAWSEMLTAAYAILRRPFRAALGGGIFRNHPWLAIDLAMVLDAPVEVSVAEAPPVYGALIECARRAGISVGEKPMKDAFLRSYAAVCGEPIPEDDE